MKKTIAIGMAALALVTTACGSSAGYKALRANPPADPSAEQKAITLLEADGTAVSAKSNRNTSLSLQMVQEIQGLSLKFDQDYYMHAGVRGNAIRDGKVAVVEIAKLSETNTCPLDTIKSEGFKTSEDLSQKYVRFNNEGRFRCLEAACNNILLILDTTRNISIVNEAGRTVSERQSATFPVLLAKDATDGTFKPVQTESDIFLQVLDKDSGRTSCLDSLVLPQSPDERGSGTSTNVDSGNGGAQVILNNDSSLEARDERAAARAADEAAQQPQQVSTAPVALNNDSSLEARDERAAAAAAAANSTTKFINDARMRAQIKRQMEADARQEAQMRARTNTTSTIQVITPVAAP